MGINKVKLANGETLVDLTGNTVNPDVLLGGYTATNAQGEQIVGTFVPEGGSGSGIIDVTELPTSGIDENAVYRLTETIQTEKNEMYFNSLGSIVTFQEWLGSMGVTTTPNYHIVDELPADMEVTDAQTFTALHIYITKGDGIAYAYVPEYGGVITVGMFAFQSMGYDKGFTENAYAEENAGVYTTIEAFKEIVRYFVRENSEWKEVTAYIKLLTSHGFADIEMLSGDITPRISAAAEIVTSEVTEIREEWFRTKDGFYHEHIKPFLFSSELLVNATIPPFIIFIEHDAFFDSENLTTVTFKGRPNQISDTAFRLCDNLTTINVPWSEGEVANAPWSATNATINYNYTGG